MNNNEIIKLRSTKFFSSSRVHSFFSSSLSELELYGRCFSLYLSYHHLQSEHVEVEDMDTPEVEEQDHLMNHQLGEEGINMVEEHDHPMNHRLERRV
jgi:hypothetical protein